MNRYLSGLLATVLSFLLVIPVNADSQGETSKNDDKCAAAVDVADSMNVNHQGCDYSDKGLNGALHRAFKKNSAKGDESPASGISPSVNTPNAEVPGTSKKSLKIVLTDEADQWSAVQSIRAGILAKAMKVCTNGFVVIGESYKPLASGRIEMSLHIQCTE